MFLVHMQRRRGAAHESVCRAGNMLAGSRAGNLVACLLACRPCGAGPLLRGRSAVGKPPARLLEHRVRRAVRPGERLGRKLCIGAGHRCTLLGSMAGREPATGSACDCPGTRRWRCCGSAAAWACIASVHTTRRGAAVAGVGGRCRGVGRLHPWASVAARMARRTPPAGCDAELLRCMASVGEHSGER